MTNYTITVNGKAYDVSVEKKRESGTAPVFQSQSVVSSEKDEVVAPMPGIIIEIKVQVGDSVKKGQELMIIEAMKMHNPILSAKDGRISELFVKVNESVQSHQPLLYIN